MAGVSSQLILDGIANKNKSIKEKAELLEWIKQQDIELLISSGAGDIDTLVQPIKEILTVNFEQNKTKY
jgi:UDP-N-acetylmuramate--alanine ligase